MQLSSIGGHSSWVLGVAACPDGKRVASCGSDKRVRVWDPSARQCLHTFDSHTEQVWAVCFSPDGKKLASVGDDAVVQIYDVGA
jgi:WD repeat-containing protein 61